MRKEFSQMFVQEKGGFTSIGAAVAILVCFALIFTLATASWHTSRSADIQAVADSAALAGSNVVAKYEIIVTVCDAIALTMGITGVIVLSVGTIAAAIPAISANSPKIVELGWKILNARKNFADKANANLSKLSAALPALVALNSSIVIDENSDDEFVYVGIAIPLPLQGEAPHVSNTDLSDTAFDIESSTEEVRKLSDEAHESALLAEEALLNGWFADCGKEGYSLYERARSKAYLADAVNPYYPTVHGWNFGVPIARATHYYAARIALEAPASDDIDEITRSIARKTFYTYALKQVSTSTYAIHMDGSLTLKINKLPENTADIRLTELYTDKVWPVTFEEQGRTIHSTTLCPGAVGPLVSTASVFELENGLLMQCDICNFSVTTLGKTPAASTSIENGFEHWWKQIAEASQVYAEEKSKQIVYEKEAKEAAAPGILAFEEALTRLANSRVNVRPPGESGCLAVVYEKGPHTSPHILSTFSSTAEIGTRMAISASYLKYDSSEESNVLANFFDNFTELIGFEYAAGGALDKLFNIWGKSLELYGGGIDSVEKVFNEALEPVKLVGLSNLASWIQNGLSKAIEKAGFEPIDLRTKKPVLTNTVNVLQNAGYDQAVTVRKLSNAAPLITPSMSSNDILISLTGITYEAIEDELVIGDIDFPGLSASIPIVVSTGETNE